jgi:hypothetical protein
MPEYVVIRVDEIPASERHASAMIFRTNQPDPETAIAVAAARFRETAPEAVYGVTLASNIARRILRATPNYTVDP